MFSYCRNNPVSRADASGRLDYECDEDIDDLDSGDHRDWTIGSTFTATTGDTNGTSGNSCVTLHRAVSASEAASFNQTGQLSCAAGQMEGKFFATCETHAKLWGQVLHADEIISVQIPSHALSHSSVLYFRRLDSIGPALYFSDIAYLNSIIS